MDVYVTTDTDLTTVADAIRDKAGITGALTFPDGFASAIPYGIPSGLRIKYIIPCSYVPARTEDGLGFDAFNLTFTRENVNQLFDANWHLQDVCDYAAGGYWLQHMFWQMCETGNDWGGHNITVMYCGHGKAGNWSGVLAQFFYGKTELSGSCSVRKNVGSSEAYTIRGQNYKGLLFIYDSAYTGQPIVDETKLSDFITISAGTLTPGW